MYRYAIVACNNCRKSKSACSGEPNCPRCKWKGLTCIFNEQSIRKRERSSKAITNIITNKDRFQCVYKSGNIKNKKLDESLDFFHKINHEFLSICSSGNKVIDEFLTLKGDQFIWIPYNLFRDIQYLSEGGFSMVYKAKWKQNDIVLKSLYNSNDINIEFLKEVESLKKFKNHKGYVSGGNLYDYLKKSYKRLTWKNKIKLLRDIAK
ncbi:3435_t:CDS:2, partial [Cetraspora pellucida]